jgi:hypothetical protein
MSALMGSYHRFRPTKSLLLAATGLLLCIRPARAADPPPLTIQCDQPSMMINRTLVIKKDVLHKLTTPKEDKPNWNIENDKVDVYDYDKKIKVTKDVVKFVKPMPGDSFAQLTGVRQTDRNSPNPAPLPIVTAYKDQRKDTVNIQVVEEATNFVPAKILVNKTKQNLTRKNDKYQLTIPMDGTVILRGTAFTGNASNPSALDSAVETWTVTGDTTVLSMSSDQGILDTGVLHCFNASQVVLKPSKAGTTSIRIANDSAVIPVNSNSASVEIEIVVTGGPTTLALTPDIATTMNHHQVASVHALAQDAAGVEVPAVITWNIADTSIVDFTDAPENNSTSVSANSDPSAYKYLKALKPGSTQVTARVPGPNGALIIQKMVVTVLPVLESVAIEAPGTILAGQEVRLHIRLLNSNDELISDSRQHIPVVVSDDYINVRFDPQDNTGRVLLVRGIKPGAGLLTLKYKNENGDQVKSAVGIRVASVAAFRPVRVSLDMMDDETAGQLFGSRTSKEFYVVRVRLFNNLDQLGAEFLGQSILAYSESIEGAVTLEKRYDPKSRTHLKQKTREHHSTPRSETDSKLDKEDSTEWKKVELKDVEGPFEREFENGDNTASVDKRFRSKPTVKFLSPDKKPSPEDGQVFALKVGEIHSLADSLKAIDAKLNVAQLLWKSANPSIATVNADTGLVIGREAGLTFVRGTDIHDQEYIAIVQVEKDVQRVLPQSPNVTARILPNLTLEVGQSAALTTFEDADRSWTLTAGDLSSNLDQWTKAIKDAPQDGAFKKAVTDVKLDLAKETGGNEAATKARTDALGNLKKFLEPQDGNPLTKDDILNVLTTLLDSDLYQKMDKKLLPTPYATYTAAQLKRSAESPSRKRRINRAVLAMQFPNLLVPKEDGDLQWVSLTEAVAAVVPQDGSNTINSNIVTAKYPGTALLIAKRGNDVVYGMQVEVSQPRTNDLPPNVFVDEHGQLQYMRHRFRYRPYAFEMMINTIDARDEKEPRTQIFKAANALATIASFFTTTSIWHGGRSSELVNGFSNIIIPGFERLYPSMKDTQRQNFVSMSMKPLEEIPFGADIARVLFFPKHSFHGIIPGYEVRIGEVVTSEFNVKVAIIDKTKAATINAAAP